MDVFTIGIMVIVIGWFILPRLRWISIKEAGSRLKDGALLLDVRSRGEYQGMKLPGSMNMPLGALEPAKLPKDRDILVYCASGTRSAMAVRQLKGLGYERVWNLGSYGRVRSALKASKTA